MFCGVVLITSISSTKITDIEDATLLVSDDQMSVEEVANLMVPQTNRINVSKSPRRQSQHLNILASVGTSGIRKMELDYISSMVGGSPEWR